VLVLILVLALFLFVRRDDNALRCLVRLIDVQMNGLFKESMPLERVRVKR
jgi:hypothetical protein